MSFPESEFVRDKFVLRKLDLPPEVTLTKKSLLRWFAISFGLISGNETRDKGLMVFDALFNHLFKEKMEPSTIDIQNYIKETHGVVMGEKLIRYHLNRLIELNLIQRKKRKYCLNHSPIGERNNLKESFNYWVKNPVNDTLDHIESVLDKIEDNYS